MSDEENINAQEGKTEFNAGIATLMRLDEIKKALAVAISNEKYEMRYRFCKVYFFELIGLLEGETEEKIVEKYNDTEESYNKYMDEKNKGFKRGSINISNVLDEWELLLRNAEQGLGLNMPKKQAIDESQDDWD